MLRSILCDYSDAYILVSGAIAVSDEAAGGGDINIQAVFRNCTPFTNSIREINKTQIDNVSDIDVVTTMYIFNRMQQ